MVLCVNLIYNLYKDPVFIKDECLPEGPHSCLSINLIFAPCTEGLKDFSGCIR